ncbi:DUF4424 family protein [Desulfococcaceae bacterium HSG7]|nr:DUF4424 family protein [Desulfococcaceae bacterium HSG7]
MRLFSQLSRITLFVIIFLSVLSLVQLEANDSAVETAAGGLQLRSEKRVSILKERLYIGKEIIANVPSNIPILENRYKIIVEYEFLNQSTQDVITEVAFPIPEFKYPGESLIQDRNIGGFKVEIDGKVISYSTEIRAIVDGQDVTALLQKVGIEIESFGRFNHHSSDPNHYQIRRLPKEMQAHLKTAGILGGGYYPKWGVSITHHWKQTFLPGKIVKVRHEYDAIPGFSFSDEIPKYLASLKKGCFDENLAHNMRIVQEQKSKQKDNVLIWADWVKYILTTANTWKMPIQNFELIVEAPKDHFVSFCWDSKLEKLYNNRFRATVSDFTPTKELLVYFFKVGE